MAFSSVFLQASCLFLTLILACACSSSDSDKSLDSQEPSEQVDDPTTPNVTDIGTEPDPQGTESVESSTTTPWAPMVTPGSNMEQLLTALDRQVSNTLLMLNQKISNGEALTQVEAACAGEYDPSLGLPLVAIECTDSAPLTAAVNSPTVRVSMPRASFFNTEVCRASLFDSHSTACQLNSSQLVISNEWVVPPSPQLPYPVAGMQISYALETPVLILESLPDGLSEPFYCKIDLLLPNPESHDCTDVISRVAERLDQLVL
ncbi:MAG: hypothetical protein AB8B63_21700 [Granulosicoccus sp.]